MAPSIQWDVDADLGTVADAVRTQYFSMSQSELLDCPEELKDRCWLGVTAPNWDDKAASILMFVYRVGWEDSKDPTAAIALKELFERSLVAKAKLSEKIIHAMTHNLNHQMKLLMRKYRVSEDDLTSNPMDVIEECYFREDQGPKSFLDGAMMMVGYRSIAIDLDESGFTPALFALREAYGFYRAGLRAAAVGSLSWVRPVLNHLDSGLSGGSRQAIGMCWSATASAAEVVEHPDESLRIWQDTLQFLSAKGNDQANCHFRIGSCLEKLNRPADAIRAYRTALDTPGLNDKTLKQIVEMALSTLRMELESDPSKARIAPELARDLGGSTDFPLTMQTIMGKLAKGERILDSEYSAGISNIRDWVAWRKSEGVVDGRSFSMLVVGLKMLLSMHDSAVAPISINQLVAETSPLQSLGNAADQAEFQSIIEHVGSLE